MIINLKIEVESKEALKDILFAGREYSFHEFKVLNWEIEKDNKDDKRKNDDLVTKRM